MSLRGPVRNPSKIEAAPFHDSIQTRVHNDRTVGVDCDHPRSQISSRDCFSTTPASDSLGPEGRWRLDILATTSIAQLSFDVRKPSLTRPIMCKESFHR